MDPTREEYDRSTYANGAALRSYSLRNNARLRDHRGSMQVDIAVNPIPNASPILHVSIAKSERSEPRGPGLTAKRVENKKETCPPGPEGKVRRIRSLLEFPPRSPTALLFPENIAFLIF